MTQLSAQQLASSLASLATESFVPQHWWVVCMLTAAHSRCPEFTGPVAAELLWAVARLCRSIQLPSEKWATDFGQCFWSAIPELLPAGAAGSGAGATSSSSGSGVSSSAAAEEGAVGAVGGNGQPNRYVRMHTAPWQQQQQSANNNPRMTARQLGLGLWGALTVGFKPSEEQWVQWEAAAKTIDWALPLDAVQASVLGYKAAGRVLPRELSRQLQRETDTASAAAHAEVEAAAAAKAAAAKQLAVQQHRMRQAAAAVAAFQRQRQQQVVAAAGGGGGVAVMTQQSEEGDREKQPVA